MLLLLDNYDSFTYNVAGMLAAAGAEVEVVRNDAATVAELLALGPERIVVSPGPGRPEDAGIAIELVRAAAAARIPLLGICLGMQAIGAAFGAGVVRLGAVVHGESSPVEHDGMGVLAALPQGFAAGRYHSLVVEEATLPAELVATAHTDAASGRVLMGMRHATLPIEGVQFHPESILTPDGHALFGEFLRAPGAAVMEVA